MEWIKPSGQIRIARYKDGTTGIILPKTMIDKLDELFKYRDVSISAEISEEEKKLVIEVKKE